MLRSTAATVLSLLLLNLAGCSPDAADPGTEPAAQVASADLVLRGGTVATVDPAIGQAQAIAISGYEIVAVGSDDQIAPISVQTPKWWSWPAGLRCPASSKATGTS
jgi:hypothetical protein